MIAAHELCISDALGIGPVQSELVLVEYFELVLMDYFESIIQEFCRL